MSMKLILHSSSLYVLGAFVLIGIALTLLVGILHQDKKEYVTTTVERGDVTEIVSVSGVVEAENSAALAFAASGLVAEVLVSEGQVVTKGDVLARLVTSQLKAERQSAVASYQKAVADKEELINGPQNEARALTDTATQNAKANLDQVTKENDEKVENAYRTLLSSSLIARTENPREDATPPTVSGTYTCQETGQYTIEPYNYRDVAFPYRVRGLEYGTFDAFFESPGSFGDCGLSLQFVSGVSYAGSEWIIDIPNTNSSVYQTNLNAYELAVEQRTSAITAAQNQLTLAEKEAALENAAPRGEAIIRANADILAAQARINAVDAQIADRTIIAPFSGIITETTILAGETATTEPVITLLASDTFDLTARIPEIDITKIETDQTAEVIFDAHPEATIPAIISFISPLATEIDGVAYFKATISFNEQPSWLRAGLNADIDIIVERKENVLRIPKRFLITNEDSGTQTVHVLAGEEIVPAPVAIGFIGNDGFIEISNIEEGAVIAAP